MAFIRSDLGLADMNFNSGLPRKWAYTTIDTDTVVSTSGYFNGVADFLKVGDIVSCNFDTDGTPVFGEVLVVSNDGTIVDVADVNLHTTTNTE